MRWIEAAIETKSEEIEDLCARLCDLGIQGISIEDEQDFQNFLNNNHQFWDYVDEDLAARYQGISRVKFYLLDSADGHAALKQIGSQLHRQFRTAVIDDEDWENSWKQYYEPIAVGTRLLIVPDWMDAPAEGRSALRLEPGLAFGTGSHATTRMCLEVLDGLDLFGRRVLDLGCGSGILGIGALVLGAEAAVGCDVDPKAPDAARHNAGLNGIGGEKFHIYAGNILTDDGLRRELGGGYDLVLANIVADVILPLSGFVRQFLKPDGLFLCSGVVDNRAEEVEAALRKNGFELLRHLHEEEWNCYFAKC